MFEGVPYGHLDEPLRSELRHRLYAESGALANLDVEAGDEEVAHLLGFGAARFPFDAGVDVLRVLAEDDDVELIGLAHRTPDALEVAHRTDAGIEVEHLAERDVQGANAAAHGRGERTLNRHAELLHGVDGLLRQPIAMIGVRLFAGVHLHPVHVPLVSVGFLDRGVENAHGSAPDVGARPIALDEWNDGIVGHAQRARFVSDAITAGRDLRELVGGHAVGRAVLEDGPSKLGSAD